jgi:cysteine desulfurase
MFRGYFDNNASTQVLSEVREAMLSALGESYGNASSIHQKGQAAKAMVEQAREQVAELIHARPAEIVFTSGGTEADNLAIFGMVPETGPAHFITSSIEHHAVLYAFQELERRGHSVTWLPVDDGGRVRPDDVRAALRPETALISVMAANNETGVLQPVDEIAGIARAAGVPFHVDAIQAVGKVPIDARALNCDLLSLSGHKIHAPQGIGALYVRRNLRLRAMLFGGHHERDRRAGSENVPGIIALGAAAELAQQSLAGEQARLGRLRDRLETAVRQEIPWVEIIGGQHERVPNTSNICFEFVEGEAMVIALDLQGFCVSTGAACSSGAVEPSHVLTAMGLPPERARSCIRFSLGKLNTEAEVDGLIAALPQAVARLRAISPAAQERLRSQAAPANL